MNLKEKFKRFWTLNVHDHQGFTLVELIIVIAILAILSGVAVVGYSSYVTKANKQADQTLAAEIKNTLILHYYSENAPYAWVILSDEGADASNRAILTEAFGNLASLALKSQWANNGTLKSSILNGKGSYTNSAYDKIGTEDLLEQVTMVTSAAANYLDYLVKGDRENAFGTVVVTAFNNDQDAMKAACDKFGISYHDDDQDGSYAFADTVTKDQIANMLVFSAANNITEDAESPTGVTTLAQSYALIFAFVARNPDDAEIKAAYDTMNNALEQDNNPAAIQGFADAMTGNTKWETYMAGITAEGDSTVKTDLNAFNNIMNAVDNVSGTVTKEEVAQSGFFASNKINDYFNDYVDTAHVLAGLPDADIAKLQAAINAGKIVILLTANGNVICSSLDLLN